MDEKLAKILGINPKDVKTESVKPKDVKPTTAKPAESKAEVSEREKAQARRAKYLEQGSYGGFNTKLYAPQRDGYKRHWANDTGGRLDELLNRGYTFVDSKSVTGLESDKAGKVCKRVGSENGKDLYAYLMEIPEEWYNEDYLRRQKERVDSKENAIKGGGENTDSNTYIPSDGIKISHGSKR